LHLYAPRLEEVVEGEGETEKGESEGVEDEEDEDEEDEDEKPWDFALFFFMLTQYI